MKPILAAVAVAFLAIVPAAAQDSPPTPTLSANGAGDVQVTPDIAIVSIGVTTRATTAGEALAANSKAAGKTIAAIIVEGVAEKDIGTSNFSIYPVYAQVKEGETQPEPLPIVGYEVTNEVRVTIRDIAKSGAILDKVVAAGANRVNGITFSVDDPQEANDGALKAAIADAARKGAIMAEAAGVKLVRIINVSASDGGGPQPYLARFDALQKSAPVMPGEQTVTVNATVIWEIAPK